MSQEDRIAPRPLRQIPNASEKARTAFVDALVKKGVALSHSQAAAVARALVDPKAATHALRFPQVKRIPTGNVTVIQVEVFVPALSVSPVNPRENEHREYPVGVPRGGKIVRQLDVASGSDHTAASLLLGAESRLHVEWLIRRSIELLRSEQIESGLKEKLALDGILKPLTLAVATLTHADKTPSVDLLISIDGSSRVAVASALTGTDPVDAIYRWPVAPRQLQSLIGQIVRVQRLDPSERTEKAEQAHRVLTCLADIVVDAQDLTGKPLPMLEACRALMSDVHIEKPLDWPEGGQRDQLADAVLAQFIASGVDPLKVAYLAGTSSRDQLPPYISPELDVRAAEIINTIYDPNNSSLVLRGVRTVGSRQRLRQNDRPEIATELVLRALRTGPEAAGKLHSRRASMIRTITDSELMPKGGNVGTRTPEVIRDAAMAELASGAATLQRDRQELGFLGAYWLVALDALRRDNRQPIAFGDGTTELDARSGAPVVKQMLGTREGIHQLYQAIADGRSGRGSINEVDEDGAILPTFVEDVALRNRFKPQKTKKGFEPTPPVITAAERLAAEADVLLAESRQLVQRRDRLVAIEHEISHLPIVMVEGLASVHTHEISSNLREVAANADVWGATFEMAAKRRAIQRELESRDARADVDPVGEMVEVDLMSESASDVT